MGQEFAKTLGYAGATIIITDVNIEKCNILAEEISHQTKSSVSGFECNVTDEKQIWKLFHEVYEKYKRIDFLIYNVMAKPDGYYRSNEEYLTRTWNEVLSGNLTGAFLCCREVSKYMKSTKQGAIVLTSSTYGIVGPDQSRFFST